MTYRNKSIQQIKYTQYQNKLKEELQGVEWPFEDSDFLEFEIIAGVSNRRADLDNVVKPLLDTYQIIFEKFNDNKVYTIVLHKHITDKGKEYLHVKVEKLIDCLPLAIVNNKELLERTINYEVQANSMPQV